MTLIKIRVLNDEEQQRLNEDYQKEYLLSTGRVVVIYSEPKPMKSFGQDVAYAIFAGSQFCGDLDVAYEARLKALTKLQGLQRGRRRGRRLENRQKFYRLMVRIADHYIEQCAIHMAWYARGPAPRRCVH